MFLRSGGRVVFSQSARYSRTIAPLRRYSIWDRIGSFWKPEIEDAPKVEAIEKPEDPETLRKTLHEHKPSWFKTEQRDHHRVQEQTTASVVDPAKFKPLLLQANKNLAHWALDKQPSPHEVDVLRGDWGDVALKLTKRYGETYGILNMANAYFFGGDFLRGGSAQEENMFLRTSCSNHITEEGGHMYIDSEGAYRYKVEMSQIINAQTLMTPEELDKLSRAYKTRIPRAFKVFMDTREPEVCFRGPELFMTADAGSFFDEGRTSRRIALSVKEGSFAYLKLNDIFPFHELRSAALDLTDSDIKVDWNDRTFLRWYREETKRRIDAQLDTAAINDIRHLVLCAFGCGAFRNRADEVASIYRQSIEERAGYFRHIVFAIYHPGYGVDNFPQFEQTLKGMPLGPRVEESRKSSFRPGMGSTNTE